ncbi:MAG: SDR family oxidoreductase [Verrucomicrobia bacterium]|nr:SDR family oxidoreductase [Verrucomicrobiota bacterium]
MKKLQGKWALVTGSSRGVGRQVALGLAEQGCNVIVHGRSLERCADTVARLKQYGVDVRVAAGELGTAAGDQAVIDAVAAEKVAVDILYNNAGIISEWSDSAFTIPMEEWQRVFQINVFSTVRLCNALIPPMVDRGWGRVVNVSSGIKNRPQRAPYSASKAAIDKYTRDLAVELAGSGVIISALDPGWLKTGIGGENAPRGVEAVLPGALVPVLLEDGSDGGNFFCAGDFQ